MRDICGAQVADKVKPVWGYTEEGEVSGIWRDCGHDGLWFGIGTSSHCDIVYPDSHLFLVE